MPRHIKITKGLNIPLAGAPQPMIADVPLPRTVALQPADFKDLMLKLLVQPGEEVLAGTPLFLDKNRPAVTFCSPVSGEVAEIVRGEKRRILEVRILAHPEIKYLPFPKGDPNNLSREAVTEALLTSGTWPLIRQRPFGIIAQPGDLPKAIFISGFDSHPLAPDVAFALQGRGADFQTGLDALRQLTAGTVHLTLRADQTTPSPLTEARGVTLQRISGPHPAGNVGVQIHHIDPVNKGEVVWYVDPQDVAIIGHVFNEGRLEATRVVAVTGPQVVQPRYYRTPIGSAVNGLVADAGLKEGDNRIISGNILTGKRVRPDGYLHYYHAQITVLREGHEPEFMGWLAPGLGKFSMSRTFFSWLQPAKTYALNTNKHGEERPFVMTGQYEKVFPMDIYPVQLLKAALAGDIELMENLGIYEVVEEDFALCEFVCTSKIEAQNIISNGLDLIRKEMM